MGIKVTEVVFFIFSFLAFLRCVGLIMATRRRRVAREREGLNGVIKLLLKKRHFRYATLLVSCLLMMASSVSFFFEPDDLNDVRTFMSFVGIMCLALLPVMIFIYVEYDSRTDAIVDDEAEKPEYDTGYKP